MVELSRSTVGLSSLVLLLVLLSPRLSLVQLILLLPAFLSLGLVSAAIALYISLGRAEDRNFTSSSDLLARQRHALRQVKFTTPSAWSAVLTRQTWEESSSKLHQGPVHKLAGPALSAKLDKFLNLIKAHFIQPWYDRISPSPAFPDAVEVVLRHGISQVTHRAEKVDWAAFTVSRLVPIMKEHLNHFRSVEHLSSSSAPSHPALPLPLPKNAHPALSSATHLHADGISPSIEAHLRGLVANMLDHILPENDQTDVMTTLIREIILGSVLGSVFDMLCDGDFWNRQIDERGGRYLHEQKQVSRFLSALSTLQQPDVTPLPSAKSTPYRDLSHTASITAHSSTKQFEAFIRSIPKVKTLGEARRLRSDVERELRLARVAENGDKIQVDKTEEGKKRIKTARKYVHRLERAKMAIDARIAALSGEHKPPSIGSPQSSLVLPEKVESSVDLYAVLSDPSSLAYWLEHMERRHRSKLVQYWLTVEGFKDPLEAASQDAALNSVDTLPVASTRITESRTIIEDISFLFLAYFSSSSKEIGVSARHQAVIREYAQSPPTMLTAEDIQKMKYAMFASQQAVYQQMVEEDWADFKRSELYRKAIVNLQKPFTSDARPIPTVQPKVPLLPAPLVRQQTAPLKSPPILSSPSLPSRPTFQTSYFSPTPAKSVITPPNLTRMNFEGQHSARPPSLRFSLAGSEEANSLLQTVTDTTTPPQLHRAYSQLDNLMSPSMASMDRSPLFGQEDVDEPALISREEEEELLQEQRMQAIQAALSEIIASDDLLVDVPSVTNGDRGSVSSDQARMTPPNTTISTRPASLSVEDLKATLSSKRNIVAPQTRVPSGHLAHSVPELTHRRSLSRLSPVMMDKSGRQLFEDDEVDEQAEKSEEDDRDVIETIQSAVPGDLQLSVEISRLQDRITDLVKQEHLLNNLISQAELTGNQNELKILRRSIASVKREQRSTIFQKAQYEQQEEENRLVPGRTRISIPASMIITEESDGVKEVLRYTIQVQQVDDQDQGTAQLGWNVARRYNEFFELDRALREWAITSGDRLILEEYRKKVAELPGKKIVPILSSSQVESRRVGLQRYVQSLLTSQALCDNDLVRVFLSRSPQSIHESRDGNTASVYMSSLAPHNIVKSLYRTMATSLDDALLGPNMLDLMYNSLNRQLVDVAGGIGGLVGLAPGLDGISALPSLASREMALGTSPKKDGQTNGTGLGVGVAENEETAVSSFTAPICDLFVELFDLKENKNNWLRKQAIVVILQQFLGSTIERKVRDTFRSGLSQKALEKSLDTLQDTLFPGGERRPPSETRTEQEKHDTRSRASRKLGLLIPDVAANMIGRSNARRAARRVCGALQDKRLNQQLMLRTLDEIFATLFPPVKKKQAT